MIYTHYSHNIFELDRNHRYWNTHFIKPGGLWISKDGESSWDHWCASEEFGIGDHKYELTLLKNNNLLHLCDYADLTNFTNQYKKADDPRFEGLGSMWIDWDRVKQGYQGLMIFPYCWEARLELMWYYGWDCASGCIWDLSCVDTFSYVQMTETETVE